MKKSFILLTILVAIINFSCKKGKESVTLILDWTPNTNHTGLYVAKELGYFEKEGAPDLSIVEPPEESTTMLVATGKAELGVSFQDTIAQGLCGEYPIPVTAVAAILQHNTSGIISLKKKGITKPLDLCGHTYASWNTPIDIATVKHLVKKEGGDFSKVEILPISVSSAVEALQTNTDSICIYYGWDGVACCLFGLETNFIAFKDVDPVFDFYTPIIIANNTYLEKNKEEVKKILRAIKRGYEYAASNPSEAAGILLKHCPELDKDLVEVSQKYLSAKYIEDAKEWGKFDKKRWSAYYEWLNENNLLKEKIEVNIGYTNEYLE